MSTPRLSKALLGEVRRNRAARDLFRFPLHAGDFYPLYHGATLLGFVAAKPLFRRCDPRGRIDRGEGYLDAIGILFVPRDARSAEDIRVLVARTPGGILGEDGRPDRKTMRRAANAIAGDIFGKKTTR